MAPDGAVTTLASFSRAAGNPRAALVLGLDGKFYGSTEGAAGGLSASVSTIFRVSVDGVLETMASFPNGSPPVAPNALVQGSDGDFYGTTAAGGAQQQGSVFRLSRDGMFTTLASFSGLDGSSPKAGLVEGTDGNFYGTTETGGSSNNGTAFRRHAGRDLDLWRTFPSPPVWVDPLSGTDSDRNGNFYSVTRSGGAKRSGCRV